eukprot:CAMPEP_0175820886 /NCGR_PEP_ID=MMETSP0107_2-20121207/8841_1 /TAXON_ID=195067 ORGANISM="Goniomonas pacifica, Strain CCMP1869" /NCGR_SAMPLE_ID=MMETSP0107_2 /ASSEMBLY_ACC=CAM_ASM_000203 /LENGTH=58 /DNA_ID=CAMNT_0017133229 /DNA_START=503 /DNA_END=676 /DNA_ORIENTATION=+
MDEEGTSHGVYAEWRYVGASGRLGDVTWFHRPLRVNIFLPELVGYFSRLNLLPQRTKH